MKLYKCFKTLKILFPPDYLLLHFKKCFVFESFWSGYVLYGAPLVSKIPSVKLSMKTLKILFPQIIYYYILKNVLFLSHFDPGMYCIWSTINVKNTFRKIIYEVKLVSKTSVKYIWSFPHIPHIFGLNFVDEDEYVRLLMNHWSMKSSLFFKFHASKMNLFYLKTFQSNIDVVLVFCSI